MIRLFTLKNNYLSENVKSVSADYSVFGYFDGLTMKTVETDREALCTISDSMRLDLRMQRNFEKCDYYNIVGICLEETDEDFWRNGGEPFIFISCLRFLKRLENPNDFILKIKDRYKNLCIMGYTTLDSSDLVVCIRTSGYACGDDIIASYSDIIKSVSSENKLQKSFSIVVVHQAVLDVLSGTVESCGWTENDIIIANREIEKLMEETLYCSVRCVVKDRDRFETFYNSVKEKCEIPPVVYSVLGSDDMVFDLQSVPSRRLLGFYGKNGIFTHDNDKYRKALYNARSEIMIPKYIKRVQSEVVASNCDKQDIAADA